MDRSLLPDEEFTQVANEIKEELGTQDDDKLEKNEKLDKFKDDFGDVNFYTLEILMILDPNQDFKTVRSNLKMFLLPAFQILVPFGMCWYFLVQKQLITDNGYCCNHDNYIFRFTGFITFMYSGWQIIDGCDDASAKIFFDMAIRMWRRTGRPEDFKAVWMFYLGYASQQLSAALLLIVTYVVFTSQCDTPLDLLMNCVAINFVLDIDSEWMSDAQQDTAKSAAEWLWKDWRDACVENGGAVKQSMKRWKSVRKAAPSICNWFSWLCDTVIWVGAYILIFAWTFCPAQY